METIPARGDRGRFTLAQFLVVVAIVAVFFALLSSAVQKLREAAARTSTTLNLKQMGLGLQNFDSAQGALPHAYGTTRDAPRPVQFHILPYMESDNYFNTIPTTRPWSSYQEPMRGGPGYVGTSGATCDYAVNACIFGNGNPDATAGTANTDPAGTNTDMRPPVLTSKGENTNRTPHSVESLAKSPRGTSKLVFAGQKRMSIGNYHARGGGDAGINHSNDDLQRGTTVIAPDPEGTATVGGWGGPYAGGVMFLKGDGSVISLRYSTSADVMAAAQDPNHPGRAVLGD